MPRTAAPARTPSGPFSAPFLLAALAIAGLSVLAPGPAAAQSCTRFVNASDGSDANDGSRTAPLRSWTAAWQRFESGTVVCVAAGEYFREGDAAGPRFVGTSRSMTFVLETFGGASEVRFSEGSFIVDAGSGSVRIQAGSASTLKLGRGVVNRHAVEPTLLNFLHSLELVSGTLDFAGVTLEIDAPVGDPTWVNPDAPTKTAPATARVLLGDAAVAGSPTWVAGNRSVSIRRTRTEEYVPLLPRSLGSGRLSIVTAGTVRFPAGLSFEGYARTPVRVGAASTGRVAIEGDLTAGPAGPGPDSLVVHGGSGTVSIARVVIAGTTPGSTVVFAGGAGRIELGSLVNAASGPVTHRGVRLETSAGASARIGAAGGETVLSGGLVNRGSVEAAGALRISGALSDGVALRNDGTLSLGASDLVLESAASHASAGSVSATTGRVVLRGSIALTGAGALPGIAAESGSSSVQSPAISGAVSVLSGASLVLASASPARVEGNVTVAGALSTAGVPALEISGTLAINGGAFSLPGTQLTMKGDVTGTGGSVSGTGAVLRAAGAALLRWTLPVSGSVPALTIAGSGLSLERALQVDGTLRVQAPLTLVGPIAVGAASLVAESSVAVGSGAALSSAGTATTGAGTLSLGSGARFSAAGSTTIGAGGMTILDDGQASAASWVVLGPVDAGARVSFSATGSVSLASSAATFAAGPAAVLTVGSSLTAGAGRLELRADSRMTVAADASLGPVPVTLGLRVPVTAASWMSAGAVSLAAAARIATTGTAAFEGSPASLGLGAAARVEAGTDLDVAGATVSGAEDAVLAAAGAFSITDGATVTLGTRSAIGAGATLRIAASSLVIGPQARLDATDLEVASGSLVQVLPDGRLVVTGATRLVASTLSLDARTSLDAVDGFTLDGGGAFLADGTSLTTGAALEILSGNLVAGESSIVSTLSRLSMTSGGLSMGAGSTLRADGDASFGTGTLALGENSRFVTRRNVDLSQAVADAPGATLRFDGEGPRTLRANASTFRALELATAATSVSVSGALSLIGDFNPAPGSVALVDAAELTLYGSLVASPATFSPGTEGVLRFAGSGQKRLEGLSGVSLPSVELLGGSLGVQVSPFAVRSLLVAGGSLTTPAGARTEVAGDLTIESGALDMGSGSTLSVLGSTNVRGGARFAAPASSLSFDGTVDAREGVLSWTDALLSIGGGRTAVLAPGGDLRLAAFTVKGDGTLLTVEGTPSLVVAGPLTVEPGATLDLNGASLRLKTDTAGASLAIGGSLLATRDVPFVVSGSPAAPVPWSGAGRVAHLRLDLATPSQRLEVRPGSAPTLSGRIELVSGRIDLAGAPLAFTDDPETPELVLSVVQNGTFRGEIVDGTGQPSVNASDTPFDLVISGSTAVLLPIAPAWEYGPVRNLSLQVTDPFNIPPVFGVVMEGGALVLGSLSLGSSTLLRLDSGDLEVGHSGAVHRIHGRVDGTGTLVLRGGTTLPPASGSPGPEVGRMKVDSADPDPVELSGFRRIGVLRHAAGTTRLSGGAVSLDSLLVTGGRLALGTSARIGDGGRPGAFLWTGGSVVLDPASNLSVAPGGRVSLASELELEVGTVGPPSLEPTYGTDPAGFVIMEGAGEISAAGGIPRLMLRSPSEGSDDVLLTGDLRVTGWYVQTGGDLFLGGHRFTHSGTLWRHDDDATAYDGGRDDVIGDALGDGPDIVVDGPVRMELGGDLELSLATMRVAAATDDTLSVRSLSATSRSLVVRNERFELFGGVVDLGTNDLVLDGSNDPALIVQSGSFVAAQSAPVGLPEGKLEADADLLPFANRLFGEVVLRSGAGAGILLQSDTAIPNLRFERAGAIRGAGHTLSVSGRLVFGSMGAGIASDESVTLSLAGGIRVIRRGIGQLSRAPSWEGPPSVYYELDDGDVTGLRTGFSAGTLNAGFELPPTVRQLVVLAGDADGSVNTVRLVQPLRVTDRLAVLGGRLDASSNDVTLGAGARFVMFDLDPDTAPVFLAARGYRTEGPITLSYASLYRDLVTSDLTFPSDATVDTLVVDLGVSGPGSPPDLLLHAGRTVGSLRMHNEAVGAALNLSGRTLTVTGDARLERGTLRSNAVANLLVGGELHVAKDASVRDGVIAQVAGRTVVEGLYAGLALRCSGDLVLESALSTGVQLSLLGRDQRVVLNSGNQSVSSLVINQGTTASTVTLSSERVPSASLAVSSVLNLSGGVLVTGPHPLRLNPGTVIQRPEAPAIPAHVDGTVIHSPPAGYTGSLLFPVGIGAEYRAIQVSFETPLLSRTELSVRASRPGISGKAGFPLAYAGPGTIRDASAYGWSLTSSVNFARAQPFALKATATGLEAGTEELTRWIARDDASALGAWRALPGTYDVTVPAAGSAVVSARSLVGELTPQGTFFAAGLPTAPAGDFTTLQLVNAADIPVDWYLGEVRALAGLAPGTAGPAVPLLLDDALDAVRSLSLRPAGVDGATDPLSVVDYAPGMELLTVAAATGGGSSIAVSPGIPLPGAPDRVQVAAVNLRGAAGAVSLAARNEAPFVENLQPGAWSQVVSRTPTAQPVRVETSDGTLLDWFDTSLTARVDGRSVLLIGDAPSGPGATLGALLTDGTILQGGIVTSREPDPAVVTEFVLRGNYPNPFNPSTRFVIDLPVRSDLRLTVLDALGRVVATLERPDEAAGSGRIVPFDAGSLASGVYFVRFDALGVDGRTRSATSSFALVR